MNSKKELIAMMKTLSALTLALISAGALADGSLPAVSPNFADLQAGTVFRIKKSISLERAYPSYFFQHGKVSSVMDMIDPFAANCLVRPNLENDKDTELKVGDRLTVASQSKDIIRDDTTQLMFKSTDKLASVNCMVVNGEGHQQNATLAEAAEALGDAFVIEPKGQRSAKIRRVVSE